ncbi:protein of unknown function [Paraburkholderia dioscoreae]|uniref:Uncharacterized protein n=1 Tax=Paraburkholderia dioscoreae TaxID=2604047 RepID=A0A5Q4ZC54_9BURK|nr:protein of unknown function [Paraburkholderia dioscoreae]
MWPICRGRLSSVSKAADREAKLRKWSDSLRSICDPASLTDSTCPANYAGTHACTDLSTYLVMSQLLRPLPNRKVADARACRRIHASLIGCE